MLAWNVDANDPKNSIPTEQYKQIAIALLAQQTKRARKTLGDVNESDDEDDSDVEEAYANCLAVPIAPEVDV